MKNRTMTIRHAMSGAVIAAACLAAISFVPSARAFTMQDANGQSGGQGYLDLDKPAAAPDRMAPVSRFGSENGQTTYKSGNGTFQFGQQRSFEQKYNTENIFNPYTRDGR